MFESTIIDDIFGDDNNETPTIEVTCEKCGGDKAYFKEMQTRSADEPMTIFYKCINIRCGHSWKDN